ncbi:MAG: copper chaperone PCu(A)C [Alphaproteobacteria bacterium]|jgi:periplasmic copper chaperone A|nr:copper chaperone PCu(A)C [Alphaproteobacteria bacterium]
MNKAILLIAAVVATILLPITHASADGAKIVTISAPWARATSTKAKSSAAFMTVKNDTGQTDRLIAAKSTIAKKTEIHLTTIENGVMKMGRVEGIDVPAGGMAMLKPGGHHVMFMGLKQQLKEGSHFPLTLVFANAGEVQIDVQVLKPGSKGNAHKHQPHKH